MIFRTIALGLISLPIFITKFSLTVGMSSVGVSLMHAVRWSTIVILGVRVLLTTFRWSFALLEVRTVALLPNEQE
jgi:hypothetical protein